MQYGGTVAGLIMVGFWVYALTDVLGADDLLTRRLAKSAWLKLVMFLPLAGGITWLLIGRPAPRSGEPDLRARRRMLDVEEFAQFVAGLQRASAGSKRAAQSWADQR
ncbi:MAG: PLD nuclease N-terminal domain-containing protein [Egibacteraceae bacterium]